MKRISYFILAACALLCGSCAEEAVEDHIVTKLDGDPYAKDDINMTGLSDGEEANSYYLPIYAYTQEAEFGVRSEYNWKITNIPSWLTVTPIEGTPSLSSIPVTCTAEENKTDSPRFGTMYLEANGKRNTITVVQDSPTFNGYEPFDGVGISGISHWFGYRYSCYFIVGGETKEFYLTSKYDWDITNIPNWVTIEPTSGKGSTKKVAITMTAPDNEGKSHKGVAKLKVGNNTIELELHQ